MIVYVKALQIGQINSKLKGYSNQFDAAARTSRTGMAETNEIYLEGTILDGMFIWFKIGKC